MLTFMVQEGILTIGAVSGIFTALLINSFKNNVIDPVVEKVAPLDKLIDFVDDGKLNNSHKKIGTPQSSTPQSSTQHSSTPQGQQQQQHGNQFGVQGKDVIKWKVFLRDFITWAIIIFILYHVWKRVIQPIKAKLAQNLQTPFQTPFQPPLQTQFQTPLQKLPMGIGKFKR